jgi:hypothetical protein
MKKILNLLFAAALLAPAQYFAQAVRPDPLPTPPAHSHAGGLHAATSLDVQVTEDIADVGTLTGTLTIDGFIVDGGVVKAEGTLTATITATDNTEVASVTDLEVTLPLTSTTGTTAEALHLELGSITVDVGGTSVTLDPVAIDLNAASSSSKAFSHLLTLASRTLDRETANLRQISRLLNLLLRLADNV